MVEATVERVRLRASRESPNGTSSSGVGEAVLRLFAGRGESSKVVI